MLILLANSDHKNQLIETHHLKPILSPINGGSVRIVRVVFNIGINERALAARILTLNLFSTTQVESDLNYNNLDKLKAFINKSLNYLPEDIPDLLKQLEHSIRSNKPKNVHIFPLAEKICRRACGVRVTGCKSAKDCTSMGFTLEQGRLLVNNHNVDKHDLQEILNRFRRNGTSIENVLANTDVKAYAFSYFQLLTFPEHYRAQQGTYGDVQTQARSITTTKIVVSFTRSKQEYIKSNNRFEFFNMPAKKDLTIEQEIDKLMALNSYNTSIINQKKATIELLKREIEGHYLEQEKYNQQIQKLYEKKSKWFPKRNIHKQFFIWTKITKRPINNNNNIHEKKNNNFFFFFIEKIVLFFFNKNNKIRSCFYRRKVGRKSVRTFQ
ncbi:hypothetical protein I4U23_021351 [Adineta vaga]|nr:hypothetical protein I4U23_021351 [Adineta vaga]